MSKQRTIISSMGLLNILFIACSGLQAMAKATATPVPPTPVPPTATPVPPTATPLPTATPKPTATASPTPEECYALDLYEAIEVQMPCDWEVDGLPITLDDGTKIATLMVAPDLEDFDTSKAPGVLIFAAREMAQWGGYVQVADAFRYIVSGDDCTVLETKQPYDDGLYRGLYDVLECDEVTNLLLVVRPATEETFPPYLAAILVQLTDDMDVDPLQFVKQVTRSFYIYEENLP